MTTDGDRTAPGLEGPLLSIDEEIDHLLWDHGDDDAVYRSEITRLNEADSDRALYGLGRAFRRLADEIEALRRQQHSISAEFQQAIMKRSSRAAWINASIEASVKARRDAGLGNFLDLPGVGRWSSRRTQPGWDLPTRTADIEALIRWFEVTPDDYQQVIDRVPTVQTPRLRAWLDAVVSEHPDDWANRLPPHVARREEGVSVSYTLEQQA